VSTHNEYDPEAHYDHVTEAWKLLLGEELHYGVFTTGDEPLDVATGELTNRMIQAAELSPGLRVLDVGCGTGAPACQLVEDHEVEVLGITPSTVGIEAATARAEARGLSDRATFERRDGTDNGLPDSAFDRAWVLESSHLMPDREALLSECARALRPGGRVVLCDIIRRRDIPFQEVRARREDFAVLRAAFGPSRMESLDYYAAAAEAAGLVVDRTDDLTEATAPTFDRWRTNADTYRDEVLTLLGEDGVAAFVRSTDILEEFWKDGTFGYGLISAHKPG
jgi:27-O-demethylrifamycin SV methyltransferase